VKKQDKSGKKNTNAKMSEWRGWMERERQIQQAQERQRQFEREIEEAKERLREAERKKVEEAKEEMLRIFESNNRSRQT